MSAATIPLMYQSPQIQDPTTLATRQLSLQQMAQASQLNQQRIQEEKLRAQQMQKDQEDQQTLNQSFLDNKGDWDATRKAVLGKVQLKTIQQMDADHLKQQQTALGLSNEKRIALQTQNQLIGTTAAGLLQLPPEQRLPAYQAALKKLQENGIDVSSYDPNTAPDDQHLMSMAAFGNYAGQLYTYAQKQALAKRSAEQAHAQELEEQGKQQQRDRENAARGYLTVHDADSHQKWLDSLPDSIKKDYANIGAYNPDNQQVVDNMALTGEQREQAKLRAQQQQQQQQYHEDTLDLRRDMANQTAAFRQASLNLRSQNTGANKPLTQGQIETQERNINNVEYGTANRPGLHAQRMKIGQMLASGVDEKGNELDDKGRAKLQSQLESVNDNLQNQQFRKAKLYGIGAPDPADVQAAKNGEEIEADDGSVWTKNNGVAFFTRMAGQEPKATTIPTRTPPAAAPPAPKTAAQPQQKVFPRAKLDAFAAANGISAQQAEQQLKSQNYVVQ